MSHFNKKYQIVFLIDGNLASCAKCDHCSEITLLVHRLLSAVRLSSKIKLKSNDIDILKTNENDSPNDVQFVWGYKLFNLLSPLPRNKSKTDNASFKNLHPEQMINFESRLFDLFESLKLSQNNATDKRKSLSSPSQLLSTALTEILHDFSWDNESVFASPVLRRHESVLVEEDNTWCNMVFILSKTPGSKISFKQFSNKMVLDSDVFIDSFMSPALLTEYQQNFKISISWIDMTSPSNQCYVKSEDDQGLCTKILQDTCTKLGGRFLSKLSFIDLVPIAKSESLKGEALVDGKSYLPLKASDWLSTEALMLDVLSAASGSYVVPIENSKQVKFSVPWFGINNAPLKLIPVSDKNNMQAQRMASNLFEDLTETEFMVMGLVQESSVSGSLMKHMSPAYLVTCSDDCKALMKFFETLEASNTLALLQATPKCNAQKTTAVLRSYSNKTFLSLIGCNTSGASDAQQELSDLQSMKSGVKQTFTQNDVKTFINNANKNLNQCMERLEQENTGSVVEQQLEGTLQLFRKHCVNSWHVPGSTRQMSGLISSIEERCGKKDNPFKNEKNGLKNLKRYYAQERQPKELIQFKESMSSTPICATRKPHGKSSAGSSQEGSSRSSSTRGLTRRSSSFLARGRMMVDRARSASLLASEDHNSGGNLSKSVGTSAEETKAALATCTSYGDLGLTSEEDLISYLKQQYELVVSSASVSETTAKTMVTVTSQFMSNKNINNPQKMSANFIQKHFLLTPQALKDKHKGDVSGDVISRRDAECKLQVLLILETESLLRDSSIEKKETLTDQLVAMLRTLSFSIGATNLRQFLTEIVSSYSVTVPKLLIDVYDELMWTLPPALAKFASPSSAAPSSVQPGSVDFDASLSSSAPGSSQAGLSAEGASNRRSSRFKQHPSLADLSQKRQILVKAVPKAKPKSESKKAVKEKHRTKSVPPVQKKRECDKAKRNLFSDSAPRALTPRSKHRHNKANRRRTYAGTSSDRARPLVMETPLRKQKPGWHIRQQEKRRSPQENIETAEQVVAESPVKEDEPEDQATMNKPARFIVREAFYSSNSQQSRNFARAVELSHKSDGFQVQEPAYEKYPSTSTRRTHGTLASAVRGESPLLSPSSKFLQAFMSSPSPTPKSKHRDDISPRRRRRDRPAKKLAKKLDFSKADEIRPSTSSNLPKKADDAHLVFDGENAVDFHQLKSPSKHRPMDKHRKGWSTPEKQKRPSFPDVWDEDSCNSETYFTPTKKSAEPFKELSFRDALPGISKEPSDDILATHSRSPRNNRTPSKKTPEKQSPSQASCHTFTSPGQASKFRSGMFTKSPKKVNAFTEILDRHHSSSICGFSPKKRHHQDKSFNNSPLRKVQRERVGDTDDANLRHPDVDRMNLPSTPQKVDYTQPGQSESSANVQFTPSKVKFLDEYLISPPTGSGCPPSAEKSTPGKSILKGSPSVKQIKIPRRVELQSIINANVKVGRAFSRETLSEPNTQSQTHAQVQNTSSSSFSIPLKINTDDKSLKHPSQSSSKHHQSHKHQHSIFDRNILETINKETISFDNCSDDEEEENSDRVKSATVQIRTPSPSAKGKAQGLQGWHRRKKCSPKQSPSSSSSNSQQSPKIAVRDGGIFKSLLNPVEKENETGLTLNIAQSSSMLLRKRSLFIENDDPEVKESPCKRLRKVSDLSADPRNGATSSFSIDRTNTDQFGFAASPELFEADEDGWTTHSNHGNVDIKLGVHSGAQIFSQDASSHSFTYKDEAPPVLSNMPLYGRLTRQSSDLSQEGSLGFHIPSTSASSTTVTRRNSSHKPLAQPLAQVSNRNVSPKKSNKMRKKSVSYEVLNSDKANTDDVFLKKSLSSYEKMKDTGVTKSEPDQPECTENAPAFIKRISAASTASSGDSPARAASISSSTSSSAEKKHYSPALSATGLMKLISSPLVAEDGRLAALDRQERESRRRTHRPKSRKHLDLE